MREQNIGQHVPEAHCTACGKMVNAASCVKDDEAYPEPGDATVCLDCGHLMIFTDGLGLRDPNDEEMRDLAGNEQLLEIQKMREAYAKWRKAMDEDIGKEVQEAREAKP